MSYLVLARKWRPKTFDDIVGQEYITLTLKNAISSKKLAHALIFSGPRGVGKTSTARIVAKALNCENSKNGELVCTKDPCSFCQEISEGKSIDVQEIDAASHTGVNDVREIIENVKYLPSSGKTKVYIIDESHMLSQAAFNALLKTLEEPPEHVLFILATTGVHKIPATILSRCQRYDFKKVSVSEIKETLDQITKTEKISIDDKTLFLIAREADGSIRDSLSLLDQLIATFGSDITYQIAIEVLGIVDNYFLRSLLREIVNKNPKKCLEVLNDALKKGSSPKKIAEELTKLLRNVLMLKICGNDIVTDFSEDEKKELLEIISKESIQSLELLFNLMLESSENVQRSSFPEMSLESMIVKLSIVEKTMPINEIIEKIDRLTKKIDINNDTVSNRDPDLNKTDVKTELLHSKIEIDSDPNIEQFKNHIKEKNTILSLHIEKASSIEKIESKIKIHFDNASINYDYLMRKKSKETLKSIAKEIFNDEIDILIYHSDNSQEKETDSNKKDQIKEDPIVKDALNLFDGRILKTKAKKKE